MDAPTKIVISGYHFISGRRRQDYAPQTCGLPFCHSFLFSRVYCFGFELIFNIYGSIFNILLNQKYAKHATSLADNQCYQWVALRLPGIYAALRNHPVTVACYHF